MRISIQESTSSSSSNNSKRPVEDNSETAIANKEKRRKEKKNKNADVSSNTPNSSESLPAATPAKRDKPIDKADPVVSDDISFLDYREEDRENKSIDEIFADIKDEDSLRDDACSEASRATTDYGDERSSREEKRAQKALDTKTARHERRELQKKRFDQLRGKVEASEIRDLINWDDLIGQYLLIRAERDGLKRDLDECQESHDEYRLEARTKTEELKQKDENLLRAKTAINSHNDLLRRMNADHAEALQKAIDKTVSERDAVFLEQNRRLDKAEAELKAAEARHVDDIAAVEAKYADVARDKAQNETLIRALKGAIKKATDELEEVKVHKEFLKAELVNVRRGKAATMSIERILNDGYINSGTAQSSAATSASAPQGTSSTSQSGSHYALTQPPSKRPHSSTLTPHTGSANNSASAPSTASTVVPPGSAQGSNVPTWSPSPIIPLGGPGSKGISSVIAAVPPDYAKPELKNVTRVDEIRKFRAIWKYHRDQNLQMEDWLTFIPSTVHPSIIALLYGCRDHEGNSVYADEAIEAWKSWDVIELLDAIINCIEPIPIQVNAPIDALESVTMPTSFVSTTFVPEFLQRYTERISLHNLQYEPVASEPNPSLVRALDARIRGIGETAIKLTSKIRSLNHGELPSTFAGYIRAM